MSSSTSALVIDLTNDEEVIDLTGEINKALLLGKFTPFTKKIIATYLKEDGWKVVYVRRQDVPETSNGHLSLVRRILYNYIIYIRTLHR